MSIGANLATLTPANTLSTDSRVQKLAVALLNLKTLAISMLESIAARKISWPDSGGTQGESQMEACQYNNRHSEKYRIRILRRSPVASERRNRYQPQSQMILLEDNKRPSLENHALGCRARSATELRRMRTPPATERQSAFRIYP
jgi:hypothetical protein